MSQKRAHSIVRHSTDFIAFNTETSAAVRLKAALAVLTRPAFPNPGWQLPADLLSPKERKLLYDLATMRADLKLMDAEDARVAGL